MGDAKMRMNLIVLAIAVAIPVGPILAVWLHQPAFAITLLLVGLFL